MRRIGLVVPFCLILLGGCDEPGGLGPSRAQAAGDGAISFSGVPQPKTQAQIVGMVIDNYTGRSMPARVVRVGQVFVPGQLQPGTDVVATGPEGPVPTQLDVKATNSDGSVRFAVVSVAIRPLSAGGSLPLMLSHGSGPAAAVSSLVPLARLSADTVSVDLAMRGGTTHHIEAGPAMAQAIAAGKASLWREGPVVTEARVDVPVEGSLHVIFDIAAEAAGGLSTDIEVGNDYAMQPVGGTTDYDVTIAQRGKPLLHQDDIRHLQYTMWHTVVRSDDSGEPHIVHDPAYVLRTGALLNYDLRAGVEGSVIASEVKQMAGPGFGVLGNAGLAMYMGASGGRPDIGPTTAANATWLITQDPPAEAYALAQAEAAGSIPWHYNDVAHGRALNLDDYPTIWSDPRGGSAGTVGLTQPIYPFSKQGQIELFTKCNCFSLDNAHQPDLSFIPYLLTGSRYYLDQLVYQAAWNGTNVAPGVRQNGKGVMVTIGTGQLRGHAWSLRTIDNAAYIVPDDHPLKAYFVRQRDNNYAYFESRIPDLTRQEGEAYGYEPTLGGQGTVAPWQEEFLAMAVGQAASQGYEPARRVMQWMTHYLATRFLVAGTGFDPHDAVAYQMRVAPAQNSTPEQLFKTWKEIADGNEELGWATHGQWTKMTFPASQQEALASLATAINVTDDAQAKQAYAWLRANAMVKEDFARHQPQFSIVPQR